jgi:uncharacterized protein
MERLAIRITAGSVSAQAELNTGRTAQKLWAVLPLEAPASVWGDEIYFNIGLECPPEAPQEVVDVGDLGYWPPGRAFCIFFGPTPASQGSEIRPASAVNVIGQIRGDATIFRKVRAGTRVVIERAGS